MFLCAQLSRVYLAVSMDAYICSSPNHDHGSSAVSHDHHAGGEFNSTLLFPLRMMAGVISPTARGTLAGDGLIPVGLFDLPSGTATYTPETHSVSRFRAESWAQQMLKRRCPKLMAILGTNSGL